MLGPFWSVIEPYVREIFRRRLEIYAKESSWKRTAIGKFMTLYESTLNLERASERLYELIFQLARDDGLLVKVVVKKRLQALAKCAEQFVRAYQEVDALLSIYNEPFRLRLIGHLTIKGTLWHEFEAWVDALPTNVDSSDRATNIVRYLKVIPTNTVVKNFLQPVYLDQIGAVLDPPSDEVRKLVRKIRKDIFSKIETLSVDLSDKRQVESQLDALKSSVEGLRAVRSELAEIIRDAFPLDKLLAQN